MYGYLLDIDSIRKERITVVKKVNGQPRDKSSNNLYP